jgi:hypothetical protein
MVAPGVAVASVMERGVSCLPPSGLIVGASTGSFTVYCEEVNTLLSESPSRKAMALITYVPEENIGVPMMIGDVYTSPNVGAGTVPSVVYRIVAPRVVVKSVTVIFRSVDACVPPFGDTVGGATMAFTVNC